MKIVRCGIKRTAIVSPQVVFVRQIKIFVMHYIMRIKWAQNLSQLVVIGLRDIYVRVGVISGSVLFVGRNVLLIQIFAPNVEQI